MENTKIKNKLQKLKNLLAEVSDIGAAISLLHWDQQTYMPVKGEHARSEQIATLSRLSHQIFTSKKVNNLLMNLSDLRDQLSESDQCLLDLVQYDYQRAQRLPDIFVRNFSEITSKAFSIWVEAKQKSDFSLFLPYLKKIVELNQQKADLLGYSESPYDALLEDYERGMTANQLEKIFSPLCDTQKQIVSRITESPQPDYSWMDTDWDPGHQWEFGLQVLHDMGYDFEAGRQDKAPHPFTISFDPGDVRITTRILPNNLFSGLMASIHEGGHALYEQGLPYQYRRTPLCSVPSLGIHESQSLLWEKYIGRSQPFWEHYYPLLQSFFPDQLKQIPFEQFFQGVNRVHPSLIRVEADECTYNLHIIIRFEIERALMENRLEVQEIPHRWNSMMQELLGLSVPNDAQGCLQDVHWSSGHIGYFPTYALGSIYAAQLIETMESQIPSLWQDIGNGQFTSILEWLRKNIHSRGRECVARHLIHLVTGKEPSSIPFINYLKNKYSKLYQIDLDRNGLGA